MNTLEELQKWYASNCDGEWEEECGVTIETLDNPGWSVTIDLFETNLEGKEFSHLKDDVSGDSWIECRVEDNKFIGFGDPERLEQILKVFIEWAKSQNEDWLQPPPPLSEEEQKRISDDNFWNSLGGEVWLGRCKRKGCDRRRIKHSVMCREHHFEMMCGYPYPGK